MLIEELTSTCFKIVRVMHKFAGKQKLCDTENEPVDFEFST